MSRVKRGPATIKRRHAKNYIQIEAQKRLSETVNPFNTQTVNALHVNSVEADYYQVQDKTGYPCSCEKTESLPPNYDIPENNVPPVVPTQKGDSSEGVQIRLKDNDLFGDGPAEHIMDALEFDVSGDRDHPLVPNDKLSNEPEGNIDYEDGLFLGTNVQCGICYRAGYQPGYKAYGKQRHVFTHKDIEDAREYWTNTTKSPHTMERQVEKTPFVEFRVLVPKYFNHIIFSVRNNEKILQGEHLYNALGERLTLSNFKESAGSDIAFQVKAKEFTHVVLEFDLGIPKLVVNIGLESQTLDYSLLETIGNMPVVLPPTVHEVKSNDVLVLKKRRLALKIIDKERKITSDQRRLEWMVQTRVLQPTEALKYIAEGFKLL